MDRFYNARALEWFEVGRSELARGAGLTYREWEERGAFLPVSEAYVKFTGRASYDDLLEMTVTAKVQGLVRLRFTYDLRISGGGIPVCEGWTVHPVVDKDGKPQRIPDWVRGLLRESVEG